MTLKLKKPTVQTTDMHESNQGDTARFISLGDQRPDTGKLISSTYRLPRSAIDILEDEAKRIGQNKTMILKASILAYSNLSENEKNKWLLESMKL